jgi:hypothetical protein
MHLLEKRGRRGFGVQEGKKSKEKQRKEVRGNKDREGRIVGGKCDIKKVESGRWWRQIKSARHRSFGPRNWPGIRARFARAEASRPAAWKSRWLARGWEAIRLEGRRLRSPGGFSSSNLGLIKAAARKGMH